MIFMRRRFHSFSSKILAAK